MKEFKMENLKLSCFGIREIVDHPTILLVPGAGIKPAGIFYPY